MRLHQLLTDSARRSPEALALHGPEGPISYRELDQLADRYTTALARRGVGAGDRVVVWSRKGLHPVAVMQAALRLGALYVPVTGTNPPARLTLITESAAPALVVADEDCERRAREAGWAAADLLNFADLLLLADGDASAPPPPYAALPDEPAYILYTSGSTGMPKGVCISHRAALAFVQWAAEELDIGPGDRLSNHAPFNFDLSVFDLYAAFLTGASVHLVPEELAYAPSQLVRFIHEREITVWYSVPSAISLMMREGGLLDDAPPPALRACVFAGEPFAPHHVRTLRQAWPKVRMLNWYGPTETNVCTSYEVTDADLEREAPVPIGRACSGDTVLLDPEDAAEGEVVVAGPTVMLGYWGQEPQRGSYRTGDLARRDEAGNLHYVGRRDHMVKIRGHRIELGEVEAVVSSLDTVADAAVLVVGSGLAARLHAVVVPATDRRPSLLAVKRRCAERLPHYMIVDALTVREDLPRTPNGKLDRRLLLAEAEAARP
ncbi:amino acid adenylation domain-containing protein [Streptomyces litchfieldiae]|uniref:Amino acid adenylation domain-containing protein n=1 Tax=Streptomyces litchfieldiae TaxID=3075543 RepID=A0ABU2MZI5_9ACTN|nr:amino acid adenylation domain-containing protein [Streptomyces sp. DSM 44938]MDT0346921.1 amino acid adenylation domain-containing protein [Streptomyces sp. DSM 44938]